MFRVLEALRWEVPDWIVVPGGNLGSSSAFGKAFMELKSLGLIDRVPRLAVINAAGADTLFELVEHRGSSCNDGRPDMSIAQRYYAELNARNAKADTIAGPQSKSIAPSISRNVSALWMHSTVWFEK